MININSQLASIKTIGAGSHTSSAARSTFQSILSELSSRPLKPLAVQRFQGLAAPRSLAQQIQSDTSRI
jgi:hypothetical protein